MNLQKLIYNLIRVPRLNMVDDILKGLKFSNALDVGCTDLYLSDKLKERNIKCTSVDIDPKSELIKKEDIENLSFEDNSFDLIMSLEVLEHTYNPIKAISEIKRVSSKYILITVPYEPFFTLFRFFFWEKEHLWAITPEIFKKYLGKPLLEKKFFFKRYYMGLWDISDQG